MVLLACHNSWEEISSTERTRMIMRKLREYISDLLRNTLSNSLTHYDMSMTPHHCNLVRYYHKPVQPEKNVFDLKANTA